jgi:hypothetical protein
MPDEVKIRRCGTTDFLRKREFPSSCSRICYCVIHCEFSRDDASRARVEPASQWTTVDQRYAEKRRYATCT